jgi:SOS-response transcriptional repressor LexA
VAVVQLRADSICTLTVAVASNESSTFQSLPWIRSHILIKEQSQTKAKTNATVTTIKPRLSFAVIVKGGGMTAVAMRKD